jgi:hypothetical protein
MRRKLLYIPVLLLVVIFVFSGIGLLTPTPTYAEALQQAGINLEGLQIYFTEENGEASRFDRSPEGISRFASLLSELGANLHTLEWRKGIPTDIDLLIVPGPKALYSSEKVARLWSYLKDGGSLLLLADPTIGEFEALQQLQGFFELSWVDIGIRAQGDVVVTEAESPEGSLATDQSFLVTNFVTSGLNANHPINANIDQVAFFGARSLRIDPLLQTEEFTTIVESERNFYGEVDFATYMLEGFAEYNIALDAGRDALLLAVTYENATKGGRMVLIGDRDVATNGGGFQTSPVYSVSLVYPDNARFLVNSVAWIAGIDGQPEVSFPTPAPTGTATITPSPTTTFTPTSTYTPTPLSTLTPES